MLVDCEFASFGVEKQLYEEQFERLWNPRFKQVKWKLAIETEVELYWIHSKNRCTGVSWYMSHL